METLSPEEIRVLGVLMEKEHLTPETYPMSLNGLVQACNQKTSRDPVTDYDEEAVEQALESLNARGLANWVHQAGARVRKFRHAAVSLLEIYETGEQAVLTVLMLRGPQTLGELRQRTERIHAFPSLEAVEAVIRGLADRESPLVAELPRSPGRKERRFAHLLGGAPADVDPSADVAGPAVAEGAAASPGLPARWQNALDAATAPMQEEIRDLKRELDTLREAFDTFRKQFE